MSPSLKLLTSATQWRNSKNYINNYAILVQHNLQYTQDEVRTGNYKSAHLQLFFRSSVWTLKALSKKGNQYLLTIINEYSCFSLAYLCKDMTSTTIIKCSNQLFSIFAMPDQVYNDRRTDFLRGNSFHLSKWKWGNGQVEKLNGTLWKVIQVTLYARNMHLTEWETVLPDDYLFYSIPSLHID